MTESPDRARLLGVWTMPARNGEEPERRTVEFGDDGAMTYRIDLDGQQLLMELSFVVEGNVVVTRDLHTGGEVRARFRLVDASHLQLELGGEVFEYVRVHG